MYTILKTNDFIIDKFVCGDAPTDAQKLLAAMLENESIGESYSDMMRYRVSNRAASCCTDIYYVAHADQVALSRLWNGWGKHESAIGNFGNFVTVEEMRGQGLGHRMLDFWFEDIRNRPSLPLCFLCMGEKRASKLYFPYGFKTIEKDASYGPLYMPLGDSPADFRELCNEYYKPSDILFKMPATVEWRHEIDCLLKYSMWIMGLDYKINGTILEQALLYSPKDTQLLFTDKSRCVGWIYRGEIRIHPNYTKSEII